MAGSDRHPTSADVPIRSTPHSANDGRTSSDATSAGARPAGGDDLSFSLAGGHATLDTPAPSGSSGKIGPDDGTIGSGEFGPAAHSSDATHASGSGTIGGARRASSGPVLAGFADYELIGEVARGGMGVVYRARQISLNRVVAVKMILAGQLASEGDVARFRSEAEAAANLQHPNIVSIYEVGEYGGQHYFSMQYIDGRSLSELVRDGLLPSRKVAEIVRKLADAVQYAHEQGILHRDLKPSNVLIDAHGEPHLTDFGVAKRMSGESQLTATGAILGTPGYMPPEQAAGRREIGPAADVYSLGAILYELLTGRPPFKGERIVDVLMQVMNSEPVSPRALNPSAPEDLATVCLKCLEKDPQRRYATAAALSADLQRWLDGEPIEARPIGRAQRGWRWCRRNPLVAGLLALLLLMGLGAFVGVTSQWLVAQSALQGMQAAQAERAEAQIESLLMADADALSPILDSLRPYQAELEPLLRERIAQAELGDRERLRLSLALLPNDPSQVEYLRQRLLTVGREELFALRDALAPHREQLRPGLWQVLGDPAGDAAQRLASGLLLASYEQQADDRDADRWQASAPFLAQALLDTIAADPSAYESLVKALQPARGELFAPLARAFRDASQPESMRSLATSILLGYESDRPANLAGLLLDADRRQFLALRSHLDAASADAAEVLRTELRQPPPGGRDDGPQAHIDRQARAAIALLQLGDEEIFWPLLVHAEDPRLRSELIELLAPLGTDPALLAARLEREPDISARRALILALGNYDHARLAADLREGVLDRCAAWHSHDADAGIRAAAEWLLQRWGEPRRAADGQRNIDAPPAASEGLPRPLLTAHWQRGPEGHTLAVIDGRPTFTMGSPATEARRSVGERPHAMTIGRTYALGTKEVTVAQFRRFTQSTDTRMPPYTRMHSPDDDGPMIMVTWYRAAQYCRWLSEQAGMPEEQMCYPPIEQIKEGMQLPDDFLARTGFRLPTEAEWEYACRAGASASRAYGDSEALLASYGWYLLSADDRAWPCGTLKPNDFGLFDMHGNVWEWCHDPWTSYWENPASEDRADLAAVSGETSRVLRGGSFDSPAKALRSAFRDHPEKPHFSSDEIGFRVAQTVAP